MPFQPRARCIHSPTAKHRESRLVQAEQRSEVSRSADGPSRQLSTRAVRLRESRLVPAESDIGSAWRAPPPKSAVDLQDAWPVACAPQGPAIGEYPDGVVAKAAEQPLPV